MLAATHAIVGALAATQFNNPVIGLTIAFASHPLLDLFPHWDLNTRWSKRSKLNTLILSAADSGTGLLLGLILFGNQQNFIWLIATMLVAQWADFLEVPYHFGFEKNRFFKSVKLMQHLWHTKIGWPWGFLPQLAILLYAIIVRYNLL
jgi:hypothetical protein